MKFPIINKLVSLAKALLPDSVPEPSEMTDEELLQEVAHSMEWGKHPNEYTEERDRRLSPS